MTDPSTPIKLTSARTHRRSVDPGMRASQVTALTRARKWWDDTQTSVSSDCQALTITALRAMREAVQHELQTVHGRPPDNRIQAQVTLCFLEERCTECILRIQVFGEERPTRDVYSRLVQQRHVYTLLSEVIQQASTLSPQSHRKDQLL
jgi:hypothetical protein